MEIDEALGCASVGALNHILTAHIEGKISEQLMTLLDILLQS